ncbi:MAG: alpha/beta hydrolase family protein [Gemmatimonadaceae bacterium]
MRLAIALFYSTVAFASALSQQKPSLNADYIGVFADEPGEYVVVAPVGSGARQMLMLAETRNEQLRLLFPAGVDTFQIGPTLTQPSPVERRIVFRREGGRVAALEVTPGAPVRRRVFPRIEIARHEVEFADGNVTLRGTLYSPPRAGKGTPAIVLAHGSEASDRNSFGPLPLVFAARGYVVLSYDKRGTGASTGSWKDVGLEPLGADLAAAIEYVARRREVDRQRIAVVGASEGAWIAAIAARRTSLIHAIVAISGGAQTKGVAYVHKMKRLGMEAGLQGSRLDSAVAEAALTIDEAKARVLRDSATVTSFDRRVTYDPTEDWRKFRGAFLYVGGEADVLEPAAESARWFSDLFSSTEHPDYTIKLLPLGHHSLVRAVNGTPAEFTNLTGLKEMVPGYWSILLRWLDDRLLSRR